MVGFIHIKTIMTAQERWNANLVAVNSTLRKQVAELQDRERKLKKRNDSLEQELALEKQSCYNCHSVERVRRVRVHFGPVVACCESSIS